MCGDLGEVRSDGGSTCAKALRQGQGREQSGGRDECQQVSGVAEVWESGEAWS